MILELRNKKEKTEKIMKSANENRTRTINVNRIFLLSENFCGIFFPV